MEIFKKVILLKTILLIIDEKLEKIFSNNLPISEKVCYTNL